MKKLLLAGVFAVAATSVMAGGLNPPVVEPVIEFEVVENAAVASSGRDDWVVILMAVLVFGTAAAAF